MSYSGLKGICEDFSANVNVEKIEYFPLRSKTKQECLLLTLLFNIALKVIASETVLPKKEIFKEEMLSFFHR